MQGHPGEKFPTKRPCWSARSVEAVEVNGYRIEPGAYLERADLLVANLKGADLKGANLRWVKLEGADLERANLERASLRGANLERANLKWAHLERSVLDPYFSNLSFTKIKTPKIAAIQSTIATM